MKICGHRLLIVEDEPLLRITMADALRKEGWVVDVAEDIALLQYTGGTTGLSEFECRARAPGHEHLLDSELRGAMRLDQLGHRFVDHPQAIG